VLIHGYGALFWYHWYSYIPRISYCCPAFRDASIESSTDSDFTWLIKISSLKQSSIIVFLGKERHPQPYTSLLHTEVKVEITHLLKVQPMLIDMSDL
jgi:hypothetical protein